MSVRMRHTRGHTGNRRSHHALKTTNVIQDGGNLRLPHRIDEATGMYRGRQIAPARESRSSKKVKGPAVEPKGEHGHEHAHEHANAEAKLGKGIQGKLAAGSKPKARSGMGGQAG